MILFLRKLQKHGIQKYLNDLWHHSEFLAGKKVGTDCFGNTYFEYSGTDALLGNQY